MPANAPRLFSCLAIIGLITLCAGCSVPEIDPRYFHTEREYSLHINSNEPLSNATFYIPLPVKNGIPLAGNGSLTADVFARDNVSVEFVRSPPVPDIPGLYTVPYNPPLWVKIHADVLTPAIPPGAKPEGYARAYAVDISNLSNPESPLAFPDTIYPLETGPVFLPKINFSAQPVTQTRGMRSHELYYTPVVIMQEIPIFAEYSASPSTTVEVFSKIDMSNSWSEGYDEYGMNEYREHFAWFHSGPSSGWQVAQGEFVAAEGSYPDYSNPVWQEVLNKTASKPMVDDDSEPYFVGFIKRFLGIERPE